MPWPINFQYEEVQIIFELHAADHVLTQCRLARVGVNANPICAGPSEASMLCTSGSVCFVLSWSHAFRPVPYSTDQTPWINQFPVELLYTVCHFLFSWDYFLPHLPFHCHQELYNLLMPAILVCTLSLLFVPRLHIKALVVTCEHVGRCHVRISATT